MGKWTEEQRKKFQETMAARKGAKREKKSQAKVARKPRRKYTRRVVKPTAWIPFQGQQHEILEKLEKSFEALALVEFLGWDLVRTLIARVEEGGKT